MTATPKTIQIFLPGGDPRGARVAEITTRSVQVNPAGRCGCQFLVGRSPLKAGLASSPTVRQGCPVRNLSRGDILAHS